MPHTRKKNPSSAFDERVSFDNNSRRKKILYRYTFLVLAYYYVTQITSIIAKLLGLSSITFFAIGMVLGAVTLSFVFFMALIYYQKKITDIRANFIFFSQFGIWLFLYAYWIFNLREARLTGMFFAILALVFLASNANFIQGFSITLMATAIQVGVSYIAIFVFKQPGNFTTELFYTMCFFPSGVMISVLSEQHFRQRREIKNAKRNAEKMRDALWGEMSLAKKIQTVLLPEKPRITGFDIAAYMDPADEVGGDYYDVINVGNKDWIVIGDVSGHGVPAGLIMMMVQTSIKVTLTQHPDVDPSTLLSIINSVITANIRRLGDQKYMTIMVIAALENNRFFFSGLHQDIMIYRALQKRVETIESTGMWIGIMDNIEGMNHIDEFTMKKNDTILLYTDGLTEAWKKNSVKDKRDPEFDMFGVKRVEKILLDNGEKSADEILKKLLGALDGYKPHDDVTIVLLKRK